jgi:Txe/YoeB family toxin of Txe-Axe toxin-antitoxin module
MKSLRLLILSAFMLSGIMQACPFTITNDKKEPFMILAWGTGTAAYLKPGETEVVTPLKVGGAQESKLYFYQADGKKLNQKYTLIQTACAVTKDETKLKISQIENMINNPTPRIKVQPYKGEGWWENLKKKVQGWFSTGSETKVQPKMTAQPGAKKSEKQSTKGAQSSNGDDVKKLAEKCKNVPAAEHEQCYFQAVETDPAVYGSGYQK